MNETEPIDNKSTLVQAIFGAIWWQAITLTNVNPDLCRHIALQGHNELMYYNCYVNFL